MLKVLSIEEVPEEDVVIIEVEMSTDIADIVMQEGLARVLYDLINKEKNDE